MDPYPITENPGLLVKFGAGINCSPSNWIFAAAHESVLGTYQTSVFRECPLCQLRSFAN
jgi:hypothetical protein